MSKFLIAIFSILISVPSLAAVKASEDVLKVARMSITMYGMYRIGDLGSAHGDSLSEKQVCGLAGQAFTGFGIFSAAGLSEQEMEQQLGGLAQLGIPFKVVQDQLLIDMENCTQ